MYVELQIIAIMPHSRQAAPMTIPLHFRDGGQCLMRLLLLLLLHSLLQTRCACWRVAIVVIIVVAYACDVVIVIILTCSHNIVSLITMRSRSRLRRICKGQSSGINDAIVAHQRNGHLCRLSHLAEKKKKERTLEHCIFSLYSGDKFNYLPKATRHETVRSQVPRRAAFPCTDTWSPPRHRRTRLVNVA